MQSIAKRAREIRPFLVMDVLEKAHAMEKQGVDVIHLEVGEPDFDAPQCVKDAVCSALQKGETHYTHSLGRLDLREAVSRHYLDRYGVSVSPEQVVVTSGTSPAMLLIFAALVERGDEVVISDPHYSCYPSFIRFVDGIPVTVPVHEEDGFQFRPEAIKGKVGKKTRAIVINSPSNPTGNLLSDDRMKEIAQSPHYIVSDEIYHGLVYEGKEHSILEFTENAFVLNGFSKLYAMTGLRLGYLIAPRPFIRRMISTYDERRRYMVRQLKDIGFGISVEPAGAFYVFANARHILGDSYRLAFDILEKCHVGVAPGIDFGQNGEGYLRFSYANSIDNIAEALNRIESYIGYP
jgi:aspartate/methionine/tyrosine aminotransferase